MERKLMFSLVLFTVVVCCFFVAANPVLSTHIDELNFTEGENFTSSNCSFDFGSFGLDCDAECFRVKYVESGHVLLVDESGNTVINIIRFDNMIHFKKDGSRQFIDGELSKTGWMVDGVEVHEVGFVNGEVLYSACTKDTSSGTMIYLASPSDEMTASMINSLEF